MKHSKLSRLDSLHGTWNTIKKDFERGLEPTRWEILDPISTRGLSWELPGATFFSRKGR